MSGHESLCSLCPRKCNIDRASGKIGFCKSGSEMKIARAALHYGEEPVISGPVRPALSEQSLLYKHKLKTVTRLKGDKSVLFKGSGTVFFTGCSLCCVYCQNYQISSNAQTGRIVSVDELGHIFDMLISQGAANINLVNPTHFLDKIASTLKKKKPCVPVIYNSSGYEDTYALKQLDGLIDVYLPDFKYSDDTLSRELSSVNDYKDKVVCAINEMIRQTGTAVIKNGMIKKGVMIRHLILPGRIQNSLGVLDIIKDNFSEIPLSVMSQYTPCGRADEFPHLSRVITSRELDKVEHAVYKLGLNGFIQDRNSAGKEYIPDFSRFS